MYGGSSHGQRVTEGPSLPGQNGRSHLPYWYDIIVSGPSQLGHVALPCYVMLRRSKKRINFLRRDAAQCDKALRCILNLALEGTLVHRSTAHSDNVFSLLHCVSPY